MILEWEVMMIPMTVPNIMDKRTDRMDIPIVTPNPVRFSGDYFLERVLGFPNPAWRVLLSIQLKTSEMGSSMIR